jgi:outer membrane lipoprotein-sorting protein
MNQTSRTLLVTLIFLLLIPITSKSFANSNLSGRQLEVLLKKVDAIRNPAESYLMKVEVENSDSPRDHGVFEVSISGKSKTLINTLAPPDSAGKKYLMLDEDMWAFTPNIGRPVRISLNQRLTGQTANGDISRMSWSGDYEPKLEKDEPNAWILFLKAKKKNLTYEKIRVWINKKNNFPIKAEFLSLQGKPLKLAVYKTFGKIAGKIRPIEVVIRDAKVKTDYSIIHIKSMTPKSFSASVFNQNSLN